MEAKELIKVGLENAKRITDRTLDGLSTAELSWHPKPDANSIGLIYFHMVRSEDGFVNHIVQAKTPVWEKDKWYLKLKKDIKDTGAHYTAEQVANFVVPDMKDIQAYADAVRKQTLKYLKGLTPQDLDKKVVLPPPPPLPKTLMERHRHHTSLHLRISRGYYYCLRYRIWRNMREKFRIYAD